jgi:hypothetical protein
MALADSHTGSVEILQDLYRELASGRAPDIRDKKAVPAP